MSFIPNSRTLLEKVDIVMHSNSVCRCSLQSTGNKRTSVYVAVRILTSKSSLTF